MWATAAVAAASMSGAAAEPPKSPAPATPAKPQTGNASYFGAEIAGQKTASGGTAKPESMTAASPTLPLGSTAKVTNAATGRSVHVTVTDRGPYAKGRILDVSKRAATRLGMTDDGVAKVKVQPLPAKGRTPRPGR